MKIQFSSAADKGPGHDKGIEVPYAPAKRRVFQWRWYLTLLIVCSPLLFFLYKMAMSYVLISGPGYVSLDKTAVNATAAGIIEKMHIDIGDDLRPGQLMAQLSNQALNERKALTLAKIASLHLDTEPQARSIHDLLVEKTHLARTQTSYQQQKHERLLYLRNQGAATIAEINAAKAQVDRSLMVLNEAQQNLALFQEQTLRHQKETSAMTSTRLHLKADLKIIEASQKRLNMYSSNPGRVLEIYAQVGESVGPGTPLLLLGRSAKPEIIAYLDPKNTPHASKGSIARVILPDGKELQAVVRETPRLSSRLPANLTSPIGSRDMMLLVKLDFVKLPISYHWVDGLPVTVRFGIF